MRARAKAFAGDANDAKIKIAAAMEAATFVRTHVVQAVREGDEGAFRMTVDAEHQDVTISRDGEGEKGCGGGGGVA
jgi:ribonuclease BN (tRNA processing enzyme)